MQQVIFHDLGLKPYKEAWDYQEKLFNEVVARKLSNRELDPLMQVSPNHYLLFCEHNPVYTLGKTGNEDHLLINDKQLTEQKIEFYKNNRGGDITFHGRGQVVGYPILDLDYFFTDIHKYLRFLEEMVIRTLAEFGIQAGRLVGATGVWLDAGNPSKARKICAMGVRCSRWVTMHGFAFNVNTDLSFFDHIIPCGIQDKAVTSLQRELGKEISMDIIKQSLLRHFSDLFQVEIITPKPAQIYIS